MLLVRYREMRLKLDEACAQVRRRPQDVLLVAVSKTVDLAEVEKAIEQGCCDFGENRPDELMRKARAFPDVNWHFIGNIQSRRIPDIVACAHLIHSVCKESHLAKINSAAAALGKCQDVLLEINVSGETSKSGLDEEELPRLLKAASTLEHIRICGLMTMAPAGDLVEAERDFSRLKELQRQLRLTGTLPSAPAPNEAHAESIEPVLYPQFQELSCGMSGDWPCAVRTGSTIVRIGRAIFSPSSTVI